MQTPARVREPLRFHGNLRLQRHNREVQHQGQEFWCAKPEKFHCASGNAGAALPGHWLGPPCGFEAGSGFLLAFLPIA